MRILHICISNFYIDGYRYQENIIPTINKRDGNEVKIIASTETINQKNVSLTYVKPASYLTPEGIPVTRIRYTRILPFWIAKKVRIFPTLTEEIELFNPDVILFHGTAAFDIIKVSNYIKKYPTVKLYVDCHEAFYNSAKTWVSKNILHRLIYRYAFLKSLQSIEKVLFIGAGEQNYLRKIYKLADRKMEFFPLGGVVVPKQEKIRINNEFRKRMGFKKDELLFVHTGKLGKANKTVELIKYFNSSSIEAKLLIGGVLKDEILEEARFLIERNNNIFFLGWKNAEEIKELLCSADLYLQPGSPSATLQQAICSGAPVLANIEYYPNYPKENGFYIKSMEEMSECFAILSKDPDILKRMNEQSYRIAYEMLDYNKLAARIYR